MKVMTCEMCGSNKIIKEQGEYVCQSCGCKYSPEEAKKLLVEVNGSVEVKGVSTVENDLVRGDQCLDVQDWESALSIFASAVGKDATCFQAWYGCLRAISKDFLASQPITGDASCKISLSAAIQNSLKFADDETRRSTVSKLENWENKLQSNQQRDIENNQKLSDIRSNESLFKTLIIFVGIISCIFIILQQWGIGIFGWASMLALSCFMPNKKKIYQMEQINQNAIDYSATLTAIDKGMQGYRIV